jgi:hypothetical protein
MQRIGADASDRSAWCDDSSDQGRDLLVTAARDASVRQTELSYETTKKKGKDSGGDESLRRHVAIRSISSQSEASVFKSFELL